MIITDRNEAFKHNSCKKLAQLGKVIFTMSAQARDRHDELARIQDKYENLIMDLVEKHQEQAENIAKALVQFRKGCVDSSCKEWGALYKKLKMDLANLYTTQNQRIADIVSETQGLSKAIKSLQMAALKSASSALDAADELQKDLKIKTRPTTTSRRTIRENIKPILDQIDLMNAESEKRIKEMKDAHRKEIAKSRAEITKFLHDELNKRKGIFTEFRTQLTTLSDEIEELQEQETAISDRRNATIEEHKENRNALLAETKDTLRKLRKEIRTLKDNQKLNKKSHTAEMSDLKHQFDLTKKNHKAEIDALRSQTHSQRRQRKKYAEAYELKMQKMEQEDEAAAEKMRKKCRAEKRRRAEMHKLIVQNIAECEADMAKLSDLMKFGIDASIERMNGKLSFVAGKIEQQENDEKQRLETEKEEFIKRGKERMDVLESAIEAQIAANHKAEKDQRHAVRRLKKQYQELIDQNTAELTEKDKKFLEDVDGVKQHNASRLKEKEAEYERARERKTNDKKKRMDELQSGFNKDLEKKKEGLEKEREEAMEKQQEQLQETARAKKEESDHELLMNKTKARVAVVEKTIQNAHEEREKKLSRLQSEISRLEKAKRQLERRKKTEAQNIDEEYERKIQVEQVNLRQKVDNIAKIYDAEENKRGMDIIEAIRKVKETNNHTEDFLMRKRHELQTLVHGYDKTIEELNAQISQYQANGKEQEIKDKINATETEMKQALEALETKKEEQCNAIKASIQKQQETDRKRLEDIQRQREENAREYERQLLLIEEERKKVDETQAQEEAGYQKEFDEKKEKSDKEHKGAVTRMQMRLNSAIQLKDEMSQKYESEREKQKKANQEEIERRISENADSNANIFSHAKKTSEQLSDRITELSKRQTEVELKMIDPCSREADRKKMDSLRSTIESLVEKQESTFQAFYKMIRGAPAQVRDIEPTVNPLRSLDGKPNSGMPTTSRPSRREGSRLVTPVDKTRGKRAQVVVTPQF